MFTLHRPLSPLADARLGSLHAVFAPWVQLCAAAPFCCARHIASILEDLSLLTLLFCNVRPSEQRSDLCVGHAPADGPRDASGSPSSMRGTSASYNSHATEDGQDPRHEVTVCRTPKVDNSTFVLSVSAVFGLQVSPLPECFSPCLQLSRLSHTHGKASVNLGSFLFETIQTPWQPPCCRIDSPTAPLQFTDAQKCVHGH